MLISGALTEYAGGGVFHEAWWFRLSFLLLLVLGALNGRIGRTLRRRETAGDGRLLGEVALNAWAMCAITAVVTVLMEVKPW